MGTWVKLVKSLKLSEKTTERGWCPWHPRVVARAHTHVRPSTDSPRPPVATPTEEAEKPGPGRRGCSVLRAVGSYANVKIH